MKFETIFTKRFLVKKISTQDATQKYLSWLQDKEINKNLTYSDIKNLKQLKNYIKKNATDKNTLFLKICLKNNLHIGNIKIHKINKKKGSAFLGILIGEKKNWNLGIAQEIIHIISNHLYEKFDISKIFLGVNRRHKNAIVAYQKSGFIFFKKYKNNSQLMLRDYFNNKLAIGTAQFGSDYGIANKTGKLKTSEIKKIKKIAKLNGVKFVDTASAYRICEQRLGELGIKEFEVISKLPMTKPDNNRFKWVLGSIKKSLKKLRVSKLYGIHVHNTKYLLDKKGKELYRGLLQAKKRGLVKKIGVSTYTIEELNRILSKYKIDLVLLPFNIFDQRPVKTKIFDKLKKLGIEIHTRSTFLQGMLMINYKNIPKKFEKWKNFFRNWDKIIKNQKKPPFEICLKFVLSNPSIDKVVIGVDSAKQFKQIISKRGSISLKTTNIDASKEINLINPAKW